MIQVKIKLYPYGRLQGNKELGILDIHNDGTGTDEVGNYQYILKKEDGRHKIGKVMGHNRSDSIWKLVGRAIKKSQYV